MICIDLVEDSDDDALVIETKIKKLTYPITVSRFQDACSVMEHYQRLLESNVSELPLPNNRLVLLDLTLKNSKGFTFLEFMAKNPQLSKVPIIVVTASDSKEDVRSTFRSGGCSFIKKPFKTENFIGIFETLIIQGRVKSI